MAFNINAHVILSGPKNIKAVTKSIQKQLGTVNARINLVAPKNLTKQIGAFNKGLSGLNKSIGTLQASATSANTHLKTLSTQFRTLNKSSVGMSKSQANVQKSLSNTGKEVKQVANEIQAFGKDAALAIRRFSAFTVATGIVFGFVRAIQSATKAAINYEREVVKIVQVTGASAAKIKGLNTTIKELSVSLGVDANELAELGRMFAQTGQTIDQVRHSIDAVAKSSLAPTFGRMKDTAEGLIAAMAQFGIAAEKQEAILASLNAVSKKFAVESEDLISVIRRAGGVFAASSKGFKEPIEGLQQLIGIFTAVRSTTRESADTIAVGLRTIFTRIQRRGTIEFLKQFNIELIDVKGNFIGLFPAFQELSRGLTDIIKSGDALTLSAITEELGGVRQVGKLIPAITQFNKALQATKIAGEAAKEGLGKDVALALQPLGKQFELLQQRFNALIRDITQSKTFQNMAKVALSMANAFLSVAETLKPLLPMLATLAAIKITKGLFEFGKGFMGGLSKGGGAGGMGGTLGGAVTGGGGGGKGGGISNTALISAIKGSVTSQGRLITSTDRLMAATNVLRSSFTDVGYDIAGTIQTSTTKLIGVMGNLINALNRSASMRGLGGGKRFARGGYVSGPSHSQGGVSAVLEGGEYVIPKGYDIGGIAKDQNVGLGMVTPNIMSLKQKNTKPIKRDTILKKKTGSGVLASQSITDKLVGKGLNALNAGKVNTQGQLKQAAELAGLKSSYKFPTMGEGVDDNEKKNFDKIVLEGSKDAVSGASVSFAKSLGVDISSPKFAETFKLPGGFMGTLFETVIEAFQGNPIKAASSTTSPFDYEQGLKPFGTLFKTIADSSINFVDAKLNPADITSSEFTNKALNQLALDAYPEMQKGARKVANQVVSKKTQKKARGRAAGGSIFAPKGTDTVPAMLTPGEFVVNRKSAESFGYGNLKKINKYAKGGVAATGNVQYLAGGSGGGGFGAGVFPAEVEKLIKTFNFLDQQISETTDSFMKGDKTYDEMVGEVARLQRGIMKTNESIGKELPGTKMTQQSRKDIDKAYATPKAKTADLINRARHTDSKSGGASDEAAEKAAQKMNALTDVVGNSIGALGGFTVALSSMDFSSPQAAMASLMSLSFAITQAQSAMTAFTTYTKLSTVANKASTASEWAEVAANIKSAAVTGFKDQVSLMTGSLKKFGVRLKGAGGTMGNLAKKIPGVTNLMSKAGGLASRAGGLASGAAGAAGGAGGAAVGTAIGAAAAPLLAAAAAGWVTNKIGGMIDEQIRGKKEEIVPGVTGIRGGTEEGAGLAGMAKGMATGAAMGAFLGPVGLVVGTALGGFIGKMTEQLAQAEFNAFVEMQENLKHANEQLGRFAKLNEISATAMINLNSAVAKPIQSFDKIQAASFDKAQGGLGLGQMLGTGGTLQRQAGISGGVAGAGMSTLGAAGAGAALGAAIGSVVPLIGTLAGAIVGGIGGALVGLGAALFTTDKSIQNTALSFDRAAQSITPEFIENLNKAMGQASASLIDKLDMSQVKELAKLDTTSQDLDPSQQTNKTISAWQKMNSVLNSTTGETSRFVQELQKLAATKIEVGLIDSVRAEADLLGEDGGNEIKAAFVHLRENLDIGELVKTGNMDEVKAELARADISPELRKIVESNIQLQMEQVELQVKAAAQQKMITEAAKRSRKALDALVAGLERFGERTQGIAAQMGFISDQMKTAFAQITGEKTIGEFKKFNPFENLASASDQQIDSSIGQMKAFGGNTPEADAAFRDTGDMLKAGRDFPLAMRNVVDALDEAQVDQGGKKLTNQQVVETVQAEFKGTLPKEMLDSLTHALEGDAARQGGDAFSIDSLTEMFAEGGDIGKLLGEAFNKTKEEMAGFDKTVVAMKNSLMEVARIQEQMAKHRMAAELSMLDKQNAIRDRVNNALGQTAGGFERAVGDLQKKMTIQARGGLKPGEGTPLAGNVLDPAVLFTRLETLDQKRDKLKSMEGQGTSDEIQANSDALGKVNRELNGTKAALRELANDTRMLAAIEGKIAEQKSKEKAHTGTADSILGGLSKLMSGEMSVQDFNKQITGPLNTVEKAFDPKQSIGFTEGVDLMQKIKSGDPLIAGRIKTKVKKIAEDRGVDPSDAGAMQDIRNEVIGNLAQELGGAGSALAEQLGLPNLAGILEEELSGMFDAQNQAALLGKEMERIGNMQVGIMQQMLEREEAALATTLKNADQGFNTAVTNFENAVQEFALMRGGLDAADMASVDKDVQKAQAEEKEAKDKWDQAVQDHDKKVKEAGEKAAQEAAEKADKGNISVERKEKRVSEARAGAEGIASRESLQDIEQKKAAHDKAAAKTKSKKEFKVKMHERKTSQDSEERREKKSDAEKNPEQAAPAEPELTDRQQRLKKADEFVQGLKDQYKGKKYENWRGARYDRLQTDEAGDITNLNEENQKKYREILGEDLYQEVDKSAIADKKGGHMAARKRLQGPPPPAKPASEVKAEAEAGAKATKKEEDKVDAPLPVTTEPTAAKAAAVEKDKQDVAVGGCCSDVLVRMDTIIGLLGTGGPKSAVEAKAEESKKTEKKAEQDGLLRTKANEIAKERGVAKGDATAMNQIMDDMIINLMNNTDLKGIAEQLGLPNIGGILDSFLGGGGGTKPAAIDPTTDRLESTGPRNAPVQPPVPAGVGLPNLTDEQALTQANLKDNKKVQDSKAKNAKALQGKQTLGKLMLREQKKKEGKEIAQINSGALTRPGDTAGRLAGFRNAAIASPDLNIRSAGLSRNTGALSQQVQQQQTQQQVKQNIEAQKNNTDPRNAPVNPPVPAGDKTAAAGNVFEELRKTMEGKELAEKMSMVFETGGTYVADQIRAAFKGAIPSKIEMTAQLGTITVQLVGGKVLEAWSKGFEEKMKQNITEGIIATVKESALIDSGRENSAGENL